MNKLLNDDSLTVDQKAFIRANTKSEQPQIKSYLMALFMACSSVAYAWSVFYRDSFSLPARNVIGFDIIIAILLEVIVVVITGLGWVGIYLEGEAVARGDKGEKGLIDFNKIVVQIWESSPLHRLLAYINRFSIMLIIVGLAAAAGHWFFALFQIFVWLSWEIVFRGMRTQCKTEFKKFDPTKVEA